MRADWRREECPLCLPLPAACCCLQGLGAAEVLRDEGSLKVGRRPPAAVRGLGLEGGRTAACLPACPSRAVPH